MQIQAAIEKFSNVDWDHSADEDSEEEDRNTDEIIEESLQNLDNRAENVEVGWLTNFLQAKMMNIRMKINNLWSPGSDRKNWFEEFEVEECRVYGKRDHFETWIRQQCCKNTHRIV